MKVFVGILSALVTTIEKSAKDYSIIKCPYKGNEREVVIIPGDCPAVVVMGGSEDLAPKSVTVSHINNSSIA